MQWHMGSSLHFNAVIEMLISNPSGFLEMAPPMYMQVSKEPLWETGAHVLSYKPVKTGSESNIGSKFQLTKIGRKFSWLQ